MKSLFLLAVFMTAFFSPAVYAEQIFGIKHGYIKVPEGKTEGCNRNTKTGEMFCAKQSFCVPLTGLCVWKYADSETKKARDMATKTQNDGSFKIVDVGGKKPEKSQESFVLDDVTISGLSKQEWDKLEKEENDFARLVREIQVKKAEQEKKRKLEEQGFGGGSQGGGSQGGGSQGGGSQGGGSQGGGSQGGGSQGGGSQGGGSQGGGSQGGGSQGGGSQGGGSQGGGSQGGGSGGGSSGGGSSGGSARHRKGDVFSYSVQGWSQSNINPYTHPTQTGYTTQYCNQTINSLAAADVSRIIGVSVPNEHKGSKMIYSISCSYVAGGQKDIYDHTDPDDAKCQSTKFLKADTGKGSFSVICTKKASDISSAVGGSVSSTGGSNSSGSSSGSSASGSSSSSSGSGGGKGPNTGGSLPNGSGSSVGQGDGKGGKGDGKGGQGDAKDGQGDGRSQVVGNGSGDSKGVGDGNGDGKGKGDGKGDDKDKTPEKDEEQDLSGIEKLILGVIDAIEKMKQSITEKIDTLIAKLDALASAGNERGNQDGKQKDDSGGGRDSSSDGKDGQGDGKDGQGDGQGNGKGDGVDWGALDKDSEIGDFAKAGTFSEVGHCPADIPIDFDQFGSVSFQMKPLCDAAEKLRPVIVMFAWFISAFMVYRTINSTL